MAGDGDDAIVPFRWDVTRREQLGSLVDASPPEVDASFVSELREIAAKIVARSDGARLVFVGRSPENFFDYLSGIFADVASAPPLTLLHYSNRGWRTETLARDFPLELQALYTYFGRENLTPEDIATSAFPVRFVDLVSEGGTFGSLATTLQHWSRNDGIDWNAVRRRFGFIGLTRRTKNSPNTWRWWQNQDWLDDFTNDQIASISISPSLWDTLGNRQDKVTPSHARHRWADIRAAEPNHSDRALNALALANWLYSAGTQKEERRAFACSLAQQPQMAAPRVRDLVLSLKRSEH